jgi:hypothetical protein
VPSLISSLFCESQINNCEDLESEVPQILEEFERRNNKAFLYSLMFY